MSVQVFMSYARVDDELPKSPSAGGGFVTRLFQDVHYQLRQSGDLDTEIWRDTRNIAPSDQFDKVIRDAIDASSLLLVVLSPNWMNSPYCKLELEQFANRWKRLGAEELRHRIIVASKRFIEFGKRPSLLQGQVGHEFLAYEGPDRSGSQIEYFHHGEVRDERYYDAVRGLAASLSLRGEHIDKNQDMGAAQIAQQEDSLKQKLASVKPPRPAVDGNARKIYLAKPASDMRSAYDQLVEELSRKGFAILPDPNQDIPISVSARSFIDNALATADVSIHLLGEGEGYAPENCDPIVKLQLARAAQKLEATEGENNSLGTAFRRIIWAPKLLAEQTAQSNSSAEATVADAVSAEPIVKRQPSEVLARFGAYHPTDQLLGDGLSTFVDFILDHLVEPPVIDDDIGVLDTDGWVYVLHEKTDLTYAKALMRAFRDRGINADLPARQGNPAALRRFHQKSLTECNAVVLCWANASEVWAKTRARELNWRKLGRTGKFAFRGLFAAPPPGETKSDFLEFLPNNEIDTLVDMTKDERPIADVIEPFVHLARSPD